MIIPLSAQEVLWREVEEDIHLHDLHFEVCVEVLYAFYRLYEH